MSRWARLRHEPEAGSAGGFALIALVAAVAFMLLLGLVVDGGAKAAAADRANRIAVQAARAGAQMLTQPGDASVDQAVQTYLAAEHVTGSSTVTGDRVDVTVHVVQPTKVLSMIGYTEISVTGRGFAEARYTPPGGP